jgi:HEAT repeats
MKRHLLFWTPPAVALGLVTAALAVRGFERKPYQPALNDPNPAVRVDALRRLPHGTSDEALIEALHDEDPDVRWVAVERLGYHGSDGKAAARAKVLIPLLLDDCAYVRQQVAWSLAYIGRPTAWPLLEHAMRDLNPRLRSEAARALPDVNWPWDDWDEKDTDLMISALNKLLRDEDAHVRASARYAIELFDDRKRH